MPAQSDAFDALLRGRYLLERALPRGDREGAIARLPGRDPAPTPATRPRTPPSRAPTAACGLRLPGRHGSVRRRRARAGAGGTGRSRWIRARPTGHVARSDALLISLAPHDEVLRTLRDARQLMPGSVAVLHVGGACAGAHGTWEAALQQAQRAMALDPLSTGVRHSMISIALGARQYDLAIDGGTPGPGLRSEATRSRRCCWRTRCCSRATPQRLRGRCRCSRGSAPGPSVCTSSGAPQEAQAAGRLARLAC